MLCPGCHLPRDETIRDDPDAPRWKSEPIACNACAERSAAQRLAHEEFQGKGMDGWLWPIDRVNGQH